MNTNRTATGSAWKSRRLLAALAVLAVAFVVLAAVPAVATDSDAADSTDDATGFTSGFIIENDDDAKSILTAFGYGNNNTNAVESGKATYLLCFNKAAGDVSVKVTVKIGADNAVNFWTGDWSKDTNGTSEYMQASAGDKTGEGDTVNSIAIPEYKAGETYEFHLYLSSKADALKLTDADWRDAGTMTIKGGELVLKEDLTVNDTIKITDSLTISGQGEDKTVLTSSAQKAISIAIPDKDKTVTIKDLTLTSSWKTNYSANTTDGAANAKAPSDVGSYGIVDSQAGSQDGKAVEIPYALDVENVTFNGFSDKQIYLSYATTLTVTGCTFNGAETQLIYSVNTAKDSHKDMYGGDFGVQIRNKLANAVIDIENNTFDANCGKLSQIMLNQNASDGVVGTGTVTIKGNTFNGATPALGNVSIGMSVNFNESATKQTDRQSFKTVTIDGPAVVAYRGTVATDDGKTAITQSDVKETYAGAAYGWDLTPLKITLADAKAELVTSYADSKLTYTVSGSAAVNGTLKSTDSLVVAGTVSSADITFAAEGQKITLKSGAVFNGTVSYTAASTATTETTGADQTSSVVFKNLKSGDDETAITAGSISISGTIDASSTVEITASGEVKLNGVTVTSTSTNTGGLVISEDSSNTSTTVTVSGTLTVSDKATLTVDSGATLTVDSGATLTVDSGATVSGSVTNNGTITAAVGSDVSEVIIADTSTGKVVQSTDTSELAEGSYSGETAELTVGATQKITLTGTTTVTGHLYVYGSLIIPEGITLTIEAGGHMVVAQGAYVQILGTLVIEESDGTNAAGDLEFTQGTIDISGTATLGGNVNVGASAVLNIKEGSSVEIDGTLTSTGTVSVEVDASLTLAGAVKSGKFFVAGTIVLASTAISDDFEIDLDDGATVTIENVTLGVGEKLTIKDDGLVIYNKSNRAVATDVAQAVRGDSTNVRNSVVITGAATLYPADTSDVSIATVYSGSDAEGGATVSGLTVTTAMTSTKIASSSDLSTMSKTTIAGTSKNKYSLAYDGYYQHAYTMSLYGSTSVTGAVEYTGSSNSPIAVGTATIKFDGVTAASVPQALSLGTGLVLTATNNLSVSGNVALSYTGTAPGTGVNTAAAKTTYSQFVNSATLSLSATIDGSAAKDLFVNTDGTTAGSISVSKAGELLAYNSTQTVPISSGFEAASYSVAVKSSTGSTTGYVHHYVTVDTAIAAMNAGTTTDVSVYGKIALSASATIPSGAKLTLQSESVLSIGARSTSTGVVLTVASDAAIRDSGGQIAVNGSLYAEDKSNIAASLRNTEGSITSQVVAYQLNEKGNPVNNGWARWTNLSTALAAAESGQQIQLNGNAPISSNTTIPEGVVLDANGRTITVSNGVAFTIDGTLDLSGTNGGTLIVALAYEPGDKNASEYKAAGSIVLNGTIKYTSADQIQKGYYDGSKVASALSGTGVSDEAKYSYGQMSRTVTGSGSSATYSYEAIDGVTAYTSGYYTISGVYYSLKDVGYISTVASAAAAIATVDDQTVEVKADESYSGTISFGAVTFAGDSSKGAHAVVVVSTDFSAASITLSDAQLAIMKGVKADAEISGANGTVQLKGVVGDGNIDYDDDSTTAAAGLVVSSLAYGETEAVLGIAGYLDDYITTSNSTIVQVSTSMTLSGTVYILGASNFEVDKVSIAGNVSVVKADADESDASFDVVLGTTVEDYTETTRDNTTTRTYAATAVTVSGSLTIQDSAAVTSVKANTLPTVSNVTVNGSDVKVAVSGTLKVLDKATYNVAVLTVSGTLDVSDTDSSTLYYSGKVTVATLYVGTDSNIESERYISSATFTSDANAIGNVKVNGYAVAAAGTTVPTGWTVDDSAVQDGATTLKLGSTAYTLPTTGADSYVTVYAPTGNTKKISDIWLSTTDADFSGWKNSRGATAGDSNYVGDSGWTTVTADVKYNVYSVKIIADAGVGSVALNGVILSATTNTFTNDGNLFKAGTYTYTATANSGYDISKLKLTDAEGNAVDSIVLTGSFENSDGSIKTFVYYLSGSTATSTSGTGGSTDVSGIIDAINKNTEAVNNQDKNITVNGGDDDDNGLTNILLVVLVILIIVMAILVAMRMMRS